METRTTDNRDLSEMERLYLARIEILKAALREAHRTIETLLQNQVMENQ